MSYPGTQYNPPLTGDSPLPPETMQSFQRAMGEIQGIPARAQLVKALMQQTAPAPGVAPSPWGGLANAGGTVMNALTMKKMADQYRAALGNQAAQASPAQATASYGQPAQPGVPGGVQAPAIGGNTGITAPTPKLPLPQSLIGSLLSGGSQ